MEISYARGNFSSLLNKVRSVQCFKENFTKDGYPLFPCPSAGHKSMSHVSGVVDTEADGDDDVGAGSGCSDGGDGCGVAATAADDDDLCGCIEKPATW